MTSRCTPGLRRLAHACAAAAIATTLAACDNGNGPTNPTPTNPTPADLFRGPTGMTITAASEDKCTPKTPTWGLLPPMILSQGTITSEGGNWVVRPDGSRFGNVLINLASTGMTETDLTLNGTAQGTVIDMLSTIRFPNPDRVTMTGTTAEGTFSTRLGGLTGRMTGTLAFTDHQGGVTTCTEAIWFLFVIRR